jgi:hypothetical protein
MDTYHPITLESNCIHRAFMATKSLVQIKSLAVPDANHRVLRAD